MQNSSEFYKENSRELFIETASGKNFYFDYSPFDIGDVAHALSNQCRYTGHCRKFYSVAEHSILVSEIMKRYNLGDPFEGFMHDASEAYLSDIAAPWKVLLPDYKKLETILDARMRNQFNLPAKMTDGCKMADWVALFVEARQIVPSKATEWMAPAGVKEMAESTKIELRLFAPEDARKAFEWNFAQLSNPPSPLNLSTPELNTATSL